MTDTTATTPQTELHRHPVRAFFWSIPLGLGIVLILIVTKVIELSLTNVIIVFVIVLVLGTLWGAFGPAKKPKGPPPVPASARTAPEASRFDDFGGPAAAADDAPTVEAVSDATPDESAGDDADTESSDDEQH